MSDWIDECPHCGAHSFDTVDNYCMDCGHNANEDYTLDSELECQKIDMGVYDEPDGRDGRYDWATD